MGTAWLWSTMKVDLIPEPAASLTHLSRSLEGSARYPLTIKVASSLEGSSGLELLARHPERWRSADVFIGGGSPSSLSTIKDNFPLPQLLDVCGWNRPPDDIFQVAPKLARVTLAFEGLAPKLPWSQLRTAAHYCGNMTPASKNQHITGYFLHLASHLSASGR
ncbi:hypothetical protein C8F04DRAFT_1128228 [Mycena alexandri]|uniref:Uncharacterized protein n=1 Tax=Mycena alexandri TaxID=1745969 RepID=A0AAD6WU77_9AGAR|nr:hypothetical protein C8F04DRAFT_1128228 [Mycena alexandri]